MTMSSSNTRSIYFEGRIYEGCERRMPTFYPDVIDKWNEWIWEWKTYILTLPNHEVIGTHNFSDGQCVDGIYELGYQWLPDNENDWLNIDKFLDWAKLPDSVKRIIALPKQPTGSTEGVEEKAKYLWQKFGTYFEPKFSDDGKLMQKEKQRRLVLDVIDEIINSQDKFVGGKVMFDNPNISFFQSVRKSIEQI